LRVAFTVRRWLEREEFETLSLIADYVGRDRSGSKFVINPNKIKKTNFSYNEIIEILSDVGVSLTELEKEYIRKIIMERDKVILEWLGSMIIMRPSRYLGELFNEIREYVTYDRSKKLFIVRPLYFFQLKRKLETLGFNIIDETGLKEEMKLPFKVSFTGTLRDYQIEALKKWTENNYRGVIALPTGAGKTVIALAAIAELNERTLIVVYTKEQMFQWQDKILEFLDIPSSYVGLYYGDEKRIAPITISTYQTAYRHIHTLSRHYTLLVIDECLAGDTLVVMKDGGVKEIREVKDGEKVLGGTASNKFSKRSNDLYYIKSSFTDLIATGTHPHIIVRRRRDKHNNQWFRVTENDIMVVPTYELKPGDYFLVPERIPHVTKKDWTPEQLRLVALIACDGHIERNKPIVKVAVGKHGDREWIRRIFIEGVRAFDIHEPIHEYTNGRGDYVISCYSPKLVRILTKTFGIPRGRKAHIVDISNEVFYSPLESIKAFIEVCFSCEGWLSKEHNGSKRLYFASTSRKFVLKLQLLLKKFGIHSGFTIKKRENKQHNSLHQLYIDNLDFNKAMVIFTFPRESLNTSERNASKDMNDRLGPFRLARITKIEKLHEEMEVYDFTSNGSHTFFANGIWTHNCHHLPADKFRIIAENCFAPKRMGLSATVVREDGKHEELFPLMGGIVYFKMPDDLAMRGYLAPYIIRQVYVKLTPEERKEYRELIKLYREFARGLQFNQVLEQAMRGDEKAQNALRVHSRLRQIIAKAKMKKEAVRRIVEEELRKGSKILIFTQYVDQAKELGEVLGVPVLTGDVETKQRKRILESFRDGRSKVLVVTTVGDEGLDIPDVDVGIIVTGTGSRRQFIQRLGRLLRPKEGKVARLYEIIVEGTAEEFQAQRRKRIELDEFLEYNV